MRVAEIFLRKLNIPVPKPKAGICDFIEDLLHCVATGKNVEETIALLNKTFNVQDVIPPNSFSTIASNYPLVKLSSNDTYTAVFLKLLPNYEYHLSTGESISTFTYEPKEFIQALGYDNAVKWTTFKSSFYKAIIAINEVLDNTIVVAKADVKTKSYKISFITGCKTQAQLRDSLVSLGVTSLTDFDKYVHLLNRR